MAYEERGLSKIIKRQNKKICDYQAQAALGKNLTFNFFSFFSFARKKNPKGELYSPVCIIVNVLLKYQCLCFTANCGAWSIMQLTETRVKETHHTLINIRGG